MKKRNLKIKKLLILFLVTAFIINPTNGMFLKIENVKASSVTSRLANFITRDGDKLKDGSKDFRFISFNEPDLTTDTSEVEVRDAFTTLNDVGGQVTRMYVISVQKPDDLPDTQRHISFDQKNKKLVFNENMFRILDKELALCNEYGVRMTIPFVDQWVWTGGIKQYTDFRGKSEAEFWTDPEVRGDFKQVINYILNRTNTVTGVKYKDDKAIFAWETGNEINATDEWTKDITAYIKSIDKNHLVMDGRCGINAASLSDDNVDVVSDHFYKNSDGYNYASRIKADREKSKGKKPFIVGEFGVAPTSELKSAVDEVVNDGTSGAMLWTLRYRKEKGGFYWHYEGDQYAGYHWPGSKSGDFYDEKNVVNMMRENGFKIQGLAVPPMPDISDKAPVLKPITTVTNISWVGVTPAEGYDVERADSENGPWTVVGKDVTDCLDYNVDMFHDTTAKTGNTYYYRVIGKNSTSKSKYSNVVKVENAKHIFIDEDFTDEKGRINKAYAETAGLTTSSINGDKTLIRKKASNEKVVYAAPKDIKSFKVVTYFKNKKAVEDFTFEVSADNKNYQIVTPTKTDKVNEWDQVTYSLDSIPAGMKFIRISFPNAYDDPSIPQIGRVEYEYDHDGGELKEIPPSGQTISSSYPATTVIDDFEGYKDSAALNKAITSFDFGGDCSISLDSQNKNSGNNGLKYDYDTSGIGVVAISKNLNGQDLSPYSSLKFWLKPDGSNRNIKIQFKTGKGYCFEVSYKMQDTKAKLVTIPLSDFKQCSWQVENGKNTTMDLNNMQKLNIYIVGDKGKGSIYIDDIKAVIGSKTLDDFEGYPDNTSLNAAFAVNGGGDALNISLDKNNKYEGTQSLDFNYKLGTKGYAGGTFSINGEDWSLYNALKLWIKEDGSGRNLTVQFKAANDEYWEVSIPNKTAGEKLVTIPFTAFNYPGWFTGGSGKQALNGIKELSLYIGGSTGEGHIYFDDIKIVNDEQLTGIKEETVSK